jgi:excisionase family DNA binding protein
MTTTHTLSVQDVATLLNVSPDTILYRMSKRGPCGAIKVGRRYYFSPAVLHSALALKG